MSEKKTYESPLGEFPNEIERGVSSGEGVSTVLLTVFAIACCVVIWGMM